MTADPQAHPTTTAGVVGYPISHSLSPQLHTQWIARGRMNAAYVPFAVQPDRFEIFIDALRGGAIAGLNVTLPYKRRALAAADEVRSAAAAAGSANLLLFRPDGRVEADNTDGAGLLYAFARQAPDHDLTIRPVVILGAGGAARGAAAALRAHGVREVRFANRTAAAAHALAEEFQGVGFSLNDLDAALEDCGTLINTTSAEIAGSPVVNLAHAAVPLNAVVMDMLYRPLRTAFLLGAERRGLKTVDGLDMLIGQAVPSFRAFFDADPQTSPEDRTLLLKEIGEPL